MGACVVLIGLLGAVEAPAGEGRFSLSGAVVAAPGSTVLRKDVEADAVEQEAQARFASDGVFSSGADFIFANGFDPNAAWYRAFQSGTAITGSTKLLASVSLPAGSYVALVRLQVATASGSPSTDYRLDCNLSPGMDAPTYRMGRTGNVERYVTFQGKARLQAASPIQFSCSDGNGNGSTVQSGNLIVLAVANGN